ncbi:hypothetical protein TUBRATIS_004350 [Tubulinosema ratisbonensis]|uniref:Uncharacterized protein n=1 Tax=Tubulinosema ratisbonensis TaxID=291195 RepID=A0A437APG9_9MICR|nr:hypothetical protein TUBRATIS_004350 [Tubulinosema ratisbonensis]
MFCFSFFIQHIFATEKRRLEQGDEQSIIKKRLIYTNDELIAAQVIVGLQNNFEGFHDIEEKKNVDEERDTQYDSSEFLKKEVIIVSNKVPILIDPITPETKNQIKLVKTSDLLELFNSMKNKHLGIVKYYKSLGGYENICDFYVWKSIDMRRIALDYEEQFSFNLNYLFLIMGRGNNDFIRPFFKIGFTNTNRNYYGIFSKLLIDPELNLFDLEDNLTDESLNELLRFPNVEILPEKYQLIQKKNIDFLSNMNNESRIWSSYMLKVFKHDVNYYGFTEFLPFFEQFLFFCIKDYLKLEKYPLIKFLFPEFTIIRMILDQKKELSFAKRVYFFLSTFHFKYLFFRDTIKKEIGEMQMKNEGFDILKCKYFSYFLFSSKMTCQMLIQKSINNFRSEISGYVFTNFLYFMKLKFICFRKGLNFNTLFLVNPFKITENFKVCFSVVKSTKKKFVFKTLFVEVMPTKKEIMAQYEEFGSYKVLIERLMICFNERIPENFFEAQNTENLKEFFETKFYYFLSISL